LQLEEFQNISPSLFDFIANEWKILEDFLKFSLSNAKTLIGNINHSEINKLIVLHHAQKIGFNIPKLLISDDKSEIEKFRSDENSVITKPIYEVAFFIDGDDKYLNYTRIIESDETIKETISPTLLQNYIEKKYEVRTYFRENKFWSIAMFSQSQSQTAIDNRNYNYDVTNRSEPFLLPTDLEDKIKALATKFNLNSGSVDFIYSKTNEFYFL
jgi:glutathione synthase/RimK-type ligase-like ATP-grasp enzyme